MNVSLRIVPILLLLLILLPTGASAYSYGDPNEEALAETYKKMTAELNQSTPNFAGAQAHFDAIRSELDMHMGTEPGDVVQKLLSAKDKEGVLTEMRKILVLNVARRFHGIETDFANYSANKTLIAKARATYEVLSPFVKQTDAALDETISKDFDKALTSLGNPGLFGVGAQQADLNLFKSAQTEILSSLQKQFKLASLEVGHFTQGESPGSQIDRGEAPTDVTAVKNWVPLAVIAAVIVGVVAYVFIRRRKAG